MNIPAIVDPDAIASFYVERAPDAVTWAGWQAIDAAEKAAGEPGGRPRVKLVRLADLVMGWPTDAVEHPRTWDG